jgi:hypothetical protein
MPDKNMGFIAYVPLILFLSSLIAITTLHYSYSLINAKNPFIDGGSKTENISSVTSDSNYLINLQYGPALVRNGEPTFFMANLFENNGEKQIRMRHVDCDFIIIKDGIELYKMSKKYGEPFFHSISGVMLPSFSFSEPGKYTIAIEIVGVFFVPVKPAFANFSAMVDPATGGNLEIKLST